jgi:uncharacterized membrane protein YjgN (DUF898 family)
VNLFFGIAYIVIGLSLIFWAVPLSLRYNAWTTQLRGHHPNFNPPTPEWRARNTTIMKVIFRIAGLFLVLLSVMYLLPLIAAPH